MPSVARENIGALNDKLSITVSKEDYMPAFEKKLKEYAKTANIPGFRKGMVPAGMIKKMYGPGIYSEQVLNTVEKELYNYLNTEKPDIFAQPLPVEGEPKNLDLANPQDYTFDFEIGLKAPFEIADLSKAALTKHTVEVTEDMVDEEVNRMQIKGGNMTEPESIDNNENVINFTMNEVDADGNIIEGGVSKENSVLLKYFSQAIQTQLKGKKKDDTISFKLNEAFGGDKLDMMMQDLGLQKGNADDAGKWFNLKIDKVGLVEKRELTEDFFNEIYPGREIKTEEELRNNLREEIKQYWDIQSRNQLQDQIYHKLIDDTKMEFPEQFLKRWLQVGGEKQKTAEEAEKEFPGFANQLKWMLISDKLMADNKIEVEEDEVRDSMRMEVMRYFGTMNMGGDMSWLDSYIDRMMKDEKQVDATYRKLSAEKLFNALEAKVTPTTKAVKAEELVAMQHNHQH